MNLQELKDAKAKYKDAYKSKQISKEDYRLNRDKINAALRRLDPSATKRDTVKIDEFVYNNHKKLGYSIGVIAKFTHKNPIYLKKTVDEFEEKLLFEEFKKQRRQNVNQV